jgi:hypothetical protein
VLGIHGGGLRDQPVGLAELSAAGHDQRVGAEQLRIARLELERGEDRALGLGQPVELALRHRAQGEQRDPVRIAGQALPGGMGRELVLLELVVGRRAEAPEVGPLEGVTVRRGQELERPPGLPDVQVVLGHRHLLRVEGHQTSRLMRGVWTTKPPSTATSPGPSSGA